MLLRNDWNIVSNDVNSVKVDHTRWMKAAILRHQW